MEHNCKIKNRYFRIPYEKASIWKIFQIMLKRLWLPRTTHVTGLSNSANFLGSCYRVCDESVKMYGQLKWGSIRVFHTLFQHGASYQTAVSVGCPSCLWWAADWLTPAPSNPPESLSPLLYNQHIKHSHSLLNVQPATLVRSILQTNRLHIHILNTSPVVFCLSTTFGVARERCGRVEGRLVTVSLPGTETLSPVTQLSAACPPNARPPN